ncbi:MAG: hypothetical protein KZQ65_12415 [Candidatus Thiodiazotropha sp. (ex Gloverina cf. vestifex)]|nr:hypothetical protein [Candidatus Thiodiazotropha sp. (ex Gloverina cf. vestifex)]
MNDYQTYHVMGCGASGVIKDLNPQMLPAEAWTFADQIRFNGFDAVQEKPPRPLLNTSYPVQLLLGWNDGLKGRLLLATPTGIQEVTHLEHDAAKSEVVDRTPSDHPPSPPIKSNQWTGGAFGGIPYFCAGFDHRPMVLMPDSRGQSKARFEHLANWPKGRSCSVMRHFSDCLIAINLVEVTDAGATTRRPFDIMWSDRAEPGRVPKTWDPTVPGSRAGKFSLSDGGDEVVDATTLGDLLCIYKEESLWRIKHVGGQYVFAIGRAINGVGIMGKNCAVDFHGKNYVFGRDEIFAHDGWEIARIFDGRLNRWIFNRIPDRKRHLCHVFKRPSTREIYFCFPDGDVAFANMAACYHTERKTSTLKTFEQGINTGMVFEFTSDETRGARRPFIGYGEGIRELDVEHAGRDFRLEREGIDLGKQQQVEMSQHVFLYATGTGSVTIEIVGTHRNKMQDSKSIQYPLDTPFPGQPIEVTGLSHRLRITNHDAMDFRLSGYSISFHAMGAY